MPRTVWSGAISFGLVTVPIHVVSAREDHSVRFLQVHLEDMSRVRVRKVCEIEDREVQNAEIGKGYQLTKEKIIPVLDEELREMPLPTAKAIEIEAFVPLESIDPIQIGDGYYLQPDGQVAAKPYTLLRKALERSSRVAIAKYAWSGRERLGLLRVRDNVIVLHAMHWADEIRDPAELKPEDVKLTKDEIAEAEHLIERLTRDDLEGEEFTDRYTQAVEALLEAKREHRAPPAVEEPKAPGKVVDLMAALQESVAKAKASRGEDATVHEMPKKKTAAAKKTAKKAPAKKTAAKKTSTSKKTAAKATAKKTSAPKRRSA
ncbi:Ku protein [Streptomyces sp. M41(2017)]|uniref:non-homologous end joining protein Ku n=1 Tax=Streptomyces sp. M41(2017) TaxID=1955065 RepID=UPI0009BE7A23|nr:Ku protein [Streptomyces sp. M41(2017)]OQQ13862.1 Ku protein [Streptomyces sp. M41(2017)]